MTIGNTEPVNIAYGNNLATTFDYDFYIETEEQIVVEHTNLLGVKTTLVYGVDYSVSGIGNENGGYITFPLQGSTYDTLAWNEQTDQKEMLVISLNLPFEQASEFDISGDLNKHNLEKALDYQMRCTQILKRQTDRAIKVQEGNNFNTDELVINLTTVAENVNHVTTVSENISNVNVVNDNIADVNSCADNISNINAVAGNKSNINAVNANKNNINEVNANKNNINTVASNISDVNTVKNNLTIIKSVNNNQTNINTIANNMDLINQAFSNTNQLNENTSDIADLGNMLSSLASKVIEDTAELNALIQENFEKTETETNTLDAKIDTQVATLTNKINTDVNNLNTAINVVLNKVIKQLNENTSDIADLGNMFSSLVETISETSN